MTKARMMKEQAPAGHAAEEWTPLQKIGFRFVATYVLLFIVSVPFPHQYLPDIGAVLSPLFENLAGWSGRHFFNLHASFVDQLVSDSTGLYLHVANLMILSIFICGVWSVLDRRRPNYSKAAYWLIAIAGYYLALQLFVYGFNKVFKWQFYLPEPNTLFTTVGETPRDLLYWSAMGSSRSYTIFSGAMEVLAALLLLFRRTRTIGALLAFGIMLNVAAINFGFDISVKVYSLFLLFLSGLIVAPDAKRLTRFFLRKDRIADLKWAPNYGTKRGYAVHSAVKAFVICLLLFDALSTYVVAGNFNDDTAPRPPLHGAYEVISFTRNGDSIPPLTTAHHRWRRAFVHRRGYLIIQTMDDRMHDYALRLDTINRLMLLTDPRASTQSVFEYETHNTHNGTRLTLHGILQGDSIDAEIAELDPSGLPLLRNEFHWTVDEL